MTLVLIIRSIAECKQISVFNKAIWVKIGTLNSMWRQLCTKGARFRRSSSWCSAGPAGASLKDKSKFSRSCHAQKGHSNWIYFRFFQSLILLTFFFQFSRRPFSAAVIFLRVRISRNWHWQPKLEASRCLYVSNHEKASQSLLVHTCWVLQIAKSIGLHSSPRLRSAILWDSLIRAQKAEAHFVSKRRDRINSSGVGHSKADIWKMLR